jgi:hypothetical protein
VTSQLLELEGTWEEILTYAPKLAGRRVRLTLLPAQPEAKPEQQPLSPTNQRMLELMAEWERTALTDEERDILDGLEAHLKAEPFSLRQVEDAP